MDESLVFICVSEELVGVVVAVVALVGGFEGGFEGGLGLEESVVVGLLVVEDASDGVSGGATVAMLSAPPSTMASGRRAAMASELRFNQSVSLASSTFFSFASWRSVGTVLVFSFFSSFVSSSCLSNDGSSFGFVTTGEVSMLFAMVLWLVSMCAIL